MRPPLLDLRDMLTLIGLGLMLSGAAILGSLAAYMLG